MFDRIRKMLGRPGRGPSLITVGPGEGLNFDAGTSNPAYESGNNELPVQAAVAELLRAGDVFLDVGANVGFLSVVAARLVGPTGHVVAFEPVPGNLDLIRRNAAANGFAQIEVVPAAVSDQAGRGTLVLADYVGGAALDTVAPPPDACGTLAVDLVTVDGWLAANPQLVPRLIKVDVEGAELAVLRGMTATVARCRPAVIVELDDAEAAEAEAKAVACTGFLADLGYSVRRLDDSYPDISWHVIHLLAE